MKKHFLILMLFSIFIGCFSILAQTYNGYTLYSKMGNTKTYLIDMNKNIYHQWTGTGGTGYSSYLLPGGTLLRSVSYSGNILSGAAMTGQIQKVSYSGTILWTYTYSTSSYCAHHDICPMPNGNVLLIAYEVKTAAQVSAAGCSSSMTMWPEKIVEVQQTGATTGTIVWEWHVWDHLVQHTDATKPNYGVIADHPELLNINYQTQKDWIHANGISYNAQLDQIVFSSHNLNEIYVIDHSTTTAQAATHSGGNSGKGGDFLYRWGNPAAYGSGTATNKIFNVVHDAHWVPLGCPKAGYLVAFNNKGGTNSGSCIDMINPPYNGYNYFKTTGSAYTPSTYTWRHNCLGNAQDQSNSQQLPNGNMLICIASTGYIYEIDSNQNLLWSFTAGGTCAKAFRYTLDYITGTLSSTASSSPAIICEGNSSQLNANPSISTGLTFAWSSNPAGFTSTLQNPVVNPLVTTIYTVTVTSSSDTITSSTTVTVNNLPPTPQIIQEGDTLYSSAGSGNQWYLNSTLIQGATSSYFVPNQNGAYTVVVTGSNNCASATSAVFTYSSAGTGELQTGDDLQIFPNPSTGILYLYGTVVENNNVEISVFTMNGTLLISKSNNTTLDLSSLENGIYFVTITTNKIRITRKISIIK